MPGNATNVNIPGSVAGEFLCGAREALPIVLGYVPIGFAYGLIATSTGLQVMETILMSVLVYAGSAQFIAVGLIGTGAEVVTIVTTTFFVNLRHLLMSAALYPHLKKINTSVLAALAYELTDESFAVATATFQKREATAPFLAGLQLTSHLTWVLSSLAGALSGSLLVNVNKTGLDFALPAMFIALLVLQLRSRLHLVVALVAAQCSLMIIRFIPGNWNVILATVAAATAGVLLEGALKRDPD